MALPSAQMMLAIASLMWGIGVAESTNIEMAVLADGSISSPRIRRQRSNAMKTDDPQSEERTTVAVSSDGQLISESLVRRHAAEFEKDRIEAEGGDALKTDTIELKEVYAPRLVSASMLRSEHARVQEFGNEFFSLSESGNESFSLSEVGNESLSLSDFRNGSLSLSAAGRGVELRADVDRIPLDTVFLHCAYWASQAGKGFLAASGGGTQSWQGPGEVWQMFDEGGDQISLYCNYWHGQNGKGWLSAKNANGHGQRMQSFVGSGEKWKWRNGCLWSDYWKGYLTRDTKVAPWCGAGEKWEVRVRDCRSGYTLQGGSCVTTTTTTTTTTYHGQPPHGCLMDYGRTDNNGSLYSCQSSAFPYCDRSETISGNPGSTGTCVTGLLLRTGRFSVAECASWPEGTTSNKQKFLITVHGKHFSTGARVGSRAVVTGSSDEGSREQLRITKAGGNGCQVYFTNSAGQRLGSWRDESWSARVWWHNHDQGQCKWNIVDAGDGKFELSNRWYHAGRDAKLCVWSELWLWHPGIDFDGFRYTRDCRLNITYLR